MCSIMFLKITRNIILYSSITFILAYFFVLRDRASGFSDNSKDSSMNEEELLYRLSGPIEFDSQNLLNHLRRILHPPSTKPYNLHNDSDVTYAYNYLNKYDASPIIEFLVNYYFGNSTGGFFVEAGALDGEALSNTLILEKSQNWTGLLVEPNAQMFQTLLKKNRKAWSLQGCLGTKPYPHESLLVQNDNSAGDRYNLLIRGQSALIEAPTVEERKENIFVSYERVQCYPLGSVLLALNITRVDFLSLDVEDVESYVVDNFPFDRIQVDIWLIEHRNPKYSFNDPNTQNIYDQEFIKKFTSHGYDFLHRADYLFIRRGSGYDLDIPRAKYIKSTVVRGV